MSTFAPLVELVVKYRRNVHMKSYKHVAGFTLQEVLISLAIMTVLGIAAVPAIQKEMQASVDEQGVSSIDQVVSSYKQFRSSNRRNPTSLNELATIGTYQGSGTMPWGDNIGMADIVNTEGVVKGTNISFMAKDSAQAARMVGMLSKYSPVAAGRLVTLTTPISTIETIEDQMLCRNGIGPAECNKMEVNLDVGSNDITGTGDFRGNEAELITVRSDFADVGEFSVSESIELGANSITSTGSTMTIDAPLTSFTGDVSLLGDLQGNDSDITGVNSLDADTVTTDSATITSGVISDLSGVTLDYETGEFTTVNADTTTANLGEFETATAQTVNADNVVTNTLTSTQANIDNLTASNATGTNLDLSGQMTVASLDANSSSLGNASANYLNLTGDASGYRAIFNLGSFSSLVATGDISGGDFAGNNFTTSLSSVNDNKATIDQHASLISRNKDDNSQNLLLVTGLQSDVATNRSDIALNSSNISSNKQLALDNASNISQNADSINILEQRATSIENGVATLQDQLETCKSQGGCSW